MNKLIRDEKKSVNARKYRNSRNMALKQIKSTVKKIILKRAFKHLNLFTASLHSHAVCIVSMYISPWTLKEALIMRTKQQTVDSWSCQDS